jgi:hypothetical protein
MSRYDAESLYQLVPAVYRRKDAEEGYPLRDLVEILAGQAEVVEDDIRRLYANQFIETCDPWVVPYVGDLIGVRNLHDTQHSRRAEVANTIGYRRRKGTAAVLEQLARDVTGWPARVVEFFELLGWTQYLVHLRAHSLRTPDFRDAFNLELIDGPFDSAAHTVDVRRIASRRGKHNIRNVGLYVWRLQALPDLLCQPLTINDAEARYTFSPFGNDAPLFHHPVSETGPAHIAEEINVPVPIRMRALHRDLDQDEGLYFGSGRSIVLMVPDAGGEAWEPFPGDYVACDLADWNRPLPPGIIAIDPVRGRLRFDVPDDRPEQFRVSYYHGFSDTLGGGQYERAATLTPSRTAIVGDPADPIVASVINEINADPQDTTGVFDNLADALADTQIAWSDNSPRIIEILDSRIYGDALPPVQIPDDAHLTIQAANEQRPVLSMPADFVVTGGDGSALHLNGLWIGDAGIILGGELNRLTVEHCTFVPGLALSPDGSPDSPGAVSLTLNSGSTEAEIHRSILGALLVASEATVSIADSILDAGDESDSAYGGVAGEPYGGPTNITRSTVIGTIDTREMTLGENSIFLGVVTAERHQVGCVRFCWVPRDSRVPRRYHCQPEIPDGTSVDEAIRIAARLSPRFTSLRYGEPAYCQLDWHGPVEIYQGADDESEMGAFSSLKQPQREASLRVRLNEYLPVGLEAGILFAT